MVSKHNEEKKEGQETLSETCHNIQHFFFVYDYIDHSPKEMDAAK